MKLNKNCRNNILLITIILIVEIFFNNLQIINAHNNPKSPCPNIFQYRYDGNEWFGIVNIKKPTVSSLLSQLIPIIQVKVVLSQKGRPLQNYLGEIELLTDNLNNKNKSNSLVYKVNFSNGQYPPRVTQIFVNNRLICFGPPDTAILVTVINLEHTKKISMPDLAITAEIDENDNNSSKDSFSLKQLSSFSPSQMSNFSYRSCGQIASSLSSNLFFTSEPKIIRGAWPWLAAIYINNLTTLSYQCSGSIISSRIIISAAHCLHKSRANDILIFLGRFNLNDWSEGNSLAVSCDNIFIHPDFDGNLKTFDADIAIVVLKKDIKFNDFIRPVCLWTGSTNLEYIENELGIVVGWSNSISNINNHRNQDDETMIPIPKLIQSVVISKTKCFKTNKKYQTLVKDRNFCAENVNSRIINDNSDSEAFENSNSDDGICKGYSGTGFIIFRNNRWTIRGIVSGSLPSEKDLLLSSSEAVAAACSSTTDKITIYTDVAKFLDWIIAFLI